MLVSGRDRSERDGPVAEIADHQGFGAWAAGAPVPAVKSDLVPAPSSHRHQNIEAEPAANLAHIGTIGAGLAAPGRWPLSRERQSDSHGASARRLRSHRGGRRACSRQVVPANIVCRRLLDKMKTYHEN